MIDLINFHLKRGMDLRVNNHRMLVVTDPDTDKFHVLTNMTNTEIEYLEMTKRNRTYNGIGLRKRRIH